MNNTINTAAPSFGSIYVVKGSAKQLRGYQKLLEDKSVQNNFKYNTHYLTQIFSPNQSKAQMIVATDGDRSVILNWFDKYIKKEAKNSYADWFHTYRQNDLISYKKAKQNTEKMETFLSQLEELAKSKLDQMKIFTNKEIKTYKFDDLMSKNNPIL